MSEEREQYARVTAVSHDVVVHDFSPPSFTEPATGRRLHPRFAGESVGVRAKAAGW